jgi:hypothetical protein
LRGGTFARVTARVRIKDLPDSPPGSLTIEADDVVDLGVVRVLGGSVVVQAGEIMIRRLVDVSGVNGGTIELSASNTFVDVISGARLRARGKAGVGGVIRLTGPSVICAGENNLRADGQTSGGEIRLRASASSARLFDATLSARGGGIIEINAATLIQGSGAFLVAPGGCIALSAPSLDTGGATFDSTVGSDCPGSPSGAFLGS